jgi:hypothetical protein
VGRARDRAKELTATDTFNASLAAHLPAVRDFPLECFDFLPPLSVLPYYPPTGIEAYQPLIEFGRPPYNHMATE